MTNKSSGQATSDVRAGHELNVAALEAYLVANIPGFTAPLDVKQFKHGQSNPTYLIKDGKLNAIDSQTQFVLRKKPPGALLSSTAHAVEREYRIIKALGDGTDVPVPKVYALCTDTAVIGTPFYVMEFLKGRIFEDVRMPQIPFEERKKCWFSAMETLAKLHRIDYKAIGLGDYGRPSDFYNRQMRSLSKVSAAQSAAKDQDTGEVVGPIPRMEEMFAWFKKNQPADESTIVHGDFKIDNMIFHPTEPRVIGVLDWELSTIGHPLSDLSNLLQPFYVPATAPIPGFKNHPGPLPIPGAEELMQVYCKHVGRPYPIDRWLFAVAFSFFRLSVILQGIAARVARRQASSAQAKRHAENFKPLAFLALEIVDQGDLNPSKL